MEPLSGLDMQRFRNVIYLWQVTQRLWTPVDNPPYLAPSEKQSTLKEFAPKGIKFLHVGVDLFLEE